MEIVKSLTEHVLETAVLVGKFVSNGVPTFPKDLVVGVGSPEHEWEAPILIFQDGREQPVSDYDRLCVDLTPTAKGTVR